jgi:hypothetical protein
VAAVNDLIRDALECKLDRPRVWYVAPTYSQAKKIAWDYAKHYSRDCWNVRFNESELRVDYHNGARLQLVGAENVDALRGVYADALAIDEFAFMAPTVWTSVFRPALSDRMGRATFISSVNGRNAFHALYEGAKKAPDEWFSMNLRASVSGLIDKRELAALKNDMPSEDYRQEYENDFDVAAKGSYYGSLISAAEADGRITAVPYDGAALVHTAWDLGYGDPTAIWFLQEVGRELHAIDYYETSGQPLAHYAALVKGKGYEYDQHVLPHDAAPKRLEAGGKSMVDMLTELGLRENRGRIVVAPNVSIDQGIAAVRTMLPRMWFDAKRCADGIERLRQYKSGYDEKRQVLSNRPQHDFTSHCADAMRMFAVTHKSARKLVQPVVAQRWVV